MSTPNVKPVEGEVQRRGVGGGGDGSGPNAARAHGAVLGALAQSHGQPPAANAGGLILKARWLSRRGRVGEPVRLEATLNPSVADGTAVAFEVQDAEGEVVETIQGEAGSGAATVEWTYDPAAEGTNAEGTNSEAPAADDEGGSDEQDPASTTESESAAEPKAPAASEEAAGDETKATFTFTATVEEASADSGPLDFERHFEDLLVRFERELLENDSDDTRFELTSERGDFEPQKKTLQDDRIEGDEFVDLLFERLDISYTYTLRAVSADGEGQVLFENVPYLDLVGHFEADPEQAEEPTGDEAAAEVESGPDEPAELEDDDLGATELDEFEQLFGEG
ncbi:MAG: hypothetical protein ACYS22_00420 [Planctomycetota bacterium]|jgi:hypothetical protein